MLLRSGQEKTVASASQSSRCCNGSQRDLNLPEDQIAEVEPGGNLTGEICTARFLGEAEVRGMGNQDERDWSDDLLSYLGRHSPYCSSSVKAR
jgi:hypothetical protein